MRFVGIVASGQVSVSYYNGGNAGDIDTLKTSKSTWHSIRTSQRTPGAGSKYYSLLLQYMWVAVYCGIEINLIILKERGFFGVNLDGACSSDWDTKRFFSENHLHRCTVCINVSYSMRKHRIVTTILCSGKFSSNYAVYEVMCLTVYHFIVRFLWKTHILWGIVIGIKYGGR